VSKIKHEYNNKESIKEGAERVKRCNGIGEQTGWSTKYGRQAGQQTAHVVRVRNKTRVVVFGSMIEPFTDVAWSEGGEARHCHQ
jgi:hypothetical protein